MNPPCLSYLPQEIIISEILMFLNYRYIKSFCTTNKTYNNIQDDIIKQKQRLTKGYPRPEGKCKIHQIPENVVKIPRTYGQPLMKATLDKLNYQQYNLDLVKGDIVEFNQGPDTSYPYGPKKAIYNGTALEPTEYHTDGEAYLPDSYTVIEDDVPLTYYKSFDDSNIFFNYMLVKQQCIENISYNDTRELWFTTFLYDCILYNIICYYYNVDILKDQEHLYFIKILNNEKPIFTIDDSIDDRKNTIIIDYWENYDIIHNK